MPSGASHSSPNWPGYLRPLQRNSKPNRLCWLLLVLRLESMWMAVKSPMTARRPIELQTRLTIFYLNFFLVGMEIYVYTLSMSLFIYHVWLFICVKQPSNKQINRISTLRSCWRPSLSWRCWHDCFASMEVIVVGQMAVIGLMSLI